VGKMEKNLDISPQILNLSMAWKGCQVHVPTALNQAVSPPVYFDRKLGGSPPPAWGPCRRETFCFNRESNSIPV
jgi:hypothetical protein